MQIIEKTRLASSRSLAFIFPHRIAAHLDPMGVVNQPVEDAIRYCWIADLFVPTGNGQLRRENQQLCPAYDAGGFIAK